MLEQWNSGAVILKCAGTVQQLRSDRKVVEQWNNGEVVVKCGGTVEQWRSDGKVWWNSGTVGQ